ncbi:cytosine permease [Lentilactobacillus sunkii]|jgi:cytosine permease|uniref:Cytosine permease n=1 Tax=Lentilactobacillus sunkii TaxID=481719 RepID=A0A1E7XJD6_9LACO|nr:cytosine permease [Lentilactobacillus sunkii]OFA13102.1 cytosine permease [Lentilactobacillus sunkii]
MSEKEGSFSSDFSLKQVPKSQQKSWISLFSIWVAIGVDLAAVILGVQLAKGLPLGKAIWAVILGSLILAIICTITASVGAATNLSTSMITRYVFGKKGALVYSAIIGCSLLGWFGVQVGFFADNARTAFASAFGLDWPTWVFSVIAGICMVGTALYGYRAFSKLSEFSVPFLLVLMLLALFIALHSHGLPNVQIKSTLPFGSAIALVISSFIVGAATQPDISRWAKSQKDSIIGTFFGMFIGNAFMIIVSILMSKSLGSADMMKMLIMIGMGIPGIIILSLTQWVTNTSNLYSASLGFNVIFSKVKFRALTLILGVIATAFGVFGIYNYFISFLNILGIFIAPVPGIYIAEYYLIKREFKRIGNHTDPQSIVWRSIISWIIGAVVTFLTTDAPTGLGIISLTQVPPLDGILVGFLMQYIGSKIVKEHATVTEEIE